MSVVVELTRGPMVESIYRAHVAVVDSTGKLLFQVGDGHKVTYWRSAAKPFQVLPLVATGAADAFGFTAEELAVCCASHNGEPVHLNAVRSALQKAGLGPEYLQCGAHAPYDKESSAALAARGEEPSALHSNCSGKHTGMLALAKHLGFPLHDYLDPQSQVQQLIRRYVAAASGMDPEQIVIGVDGCGVPVWGMPISNMALAFARLAEPASMTAGDIEGLPRAAAKVASAMRAAPYLVAGRKRICTALMGLPGLLAKSGAEGVYSVGIQPEQVAASAVLSALGVSGGVGITVKVEDGDNTARHLVTVEVLRQLGVITGDEADLAWYRPKVITNHAGKVVGEQRLAFTLERMISL